MKDREMKVLHKNSLGYVAKCTCCDDIQIKFGNAILSFTNEEYKDFDSFFDAIKEDFELEPRDFKCDYLVNTEIDGLILSFSYSELCQAIELMNFSNVILSCNKLLFE